MPPPPIYCYCVLMTMAILKVEDASTAIHNNALDVSNNLLHFVVCISSALVPLGPQQLSC